MWYLDLPSPLVCWKPCIYMGKFKPEKLSLKICPWSGSNLQLCALQSNNLTTRPPRLLEEQLIYKSQWRAINIQITRIEVYYSYIDLWYPRNLWHPTCTTSMFEMKISPDIVYFYEKNMVTCCFLLNTCTMYYIHPFLLWSLCPVPIPMTVIISIY